MRTLGCSTATRAARAPQGMRRVGLAISLTLGLGIPGSAATAGTAADPVDAATERSDSDERIASLVRDWFARLEGRNSGGRELTDFLAGPAFELSLAEGSVRSAREFRAWHSRLRVAYPQLVHRIGAIRVDPLADGLYRARFEFDRHAVDADGMPHVARREHVWVVQDMPGDAPVILQIDERPMLYFPGTGPQIICF